MKDTISFTVELDFSDEVKEEQVQEIANHILDALVRQVDHAEGIAPYWGTYVTEHIRVRDNLNIIDPVIHSF